MSETEHVVEGELVKVEPESLPVSVQSEGVRPERPVVHKALAVAGAVLAYAGREIVPRVAATLLDAWDCRSLDANVTASTTGSSMSERSSRQPQAPQTRAAGRQHRWRRGRPR